MQGFSVYEIDPWSHIMIAFNQDFLNVNLFVVGWQHCSNMLTTFFGSESQKLKFNSFTGDLLL